MKTFWILTIIISSFSASAQTSVIGVKSHHGDMADLPKSEDNFGEIAPMPIYDSLIRISGDCVVQVGRNNGFGGSFRDTVCEHWYYQRVNFDERKIRDFHGGRVVMVDFEKMRPENVQSASQETSKKRRRERKQSSEWLFLILVLSGLSVYVTRPTRLWK